MTDLSHESEPVQYGNLLSPKLPGLGRLSAGASVFLVCAAALVMLLSLVSMWAAVAWSVLAVLLLVPTAFPTKEGYGRYEVAWRRIRHARAASSSRTVLRQGAVGAVPDGACRLPGLGATVELSSHVDAWGREFGLLHYPSADLYACVLAANPSGFAGLDQSTRDMQAAHWAAWIAGLSAVEEIVGMAVVIETIPDSGQRLERAMERGRVADEHITDFARQVEAEIHDASRVGSPTLTARITLTLTARVDEELEKGSRTWVRPLDDMADQFADLLPGWTGGLAPTGAGQSVRPLTAQEITDATRVAFDPSVAIDVEEAQLAATAARIAGDEDWASKGTGITWDQAGPIYAENRADVYIHESHASRTFQMQSPPTGMFFTESLRPILEPHKDLERKRVTLLYRPEAPQASAQHAENAVKAARFKATQSKYGKAAAEEEYQAAMLTAKQEAKGSPLVRVGMLVTISASDMTSLRKASRTMRSTLAGSARIGLRLPKGSQDFAFLSSLPLGVVPHVSPRPPKRTKAQIEAARATGAGVEGLAQIDTLDGVLGDPFTTDDNDDSKEW